MFSSVRPELNLKPSQCPHSLDRFDLNYPFVLPHPFVLPLLHSLGRGDLNLSHSPIISTLTHLMTAMPFVQMCCVNSYAVGDKRMKDWFASIAIDALDLDKADFLEDGYPVHVDGEQSTPAARPGSSRSKFHTGIPALLGSAQTISSMCFRSGRPKRLVCSS